MGIQVYPCMKFPILNHFLEVSQGTFGIDLNVKFGSFANLEHNIIISLV